MRCRYRKSMWVLLNTRRSEYFRQRQHYFIDSPEPREWEQRDAEEGGHVEASTNQAKDSNEYCQDCTDAGRTKFRQNTAEIETDNSAVFHAIGEQWLVSQMTLKKHYSPITYEVCTIRKKCLSIQNSRWVVLKEEFERNVSLNLLRCLFAKIIW